MRLFIVTKDAAKRSVYDRNTFGDDYRGEAFVAVGRKWDVADELIWTGKTGATKF